MSRRVFEEALCTIGGALCPAWNEWFAACEDTDPTAAEEERDPDPLAAWPFSPLACERPDICPLYGRHKKSKP
jgi:hypothetical protein